jgi:hypothetical protein
MTSPFCCRSTIFGFLKNIESSLMNYGFNRPWFLFDLFSRIPKDMVLKAGGTFFLFQKGG